MSLPKTHDFDIELDSTKGFGFDYFKRQIYRDFTLDKKDTNGELCEELCWVNFDGKACDFFITFEKRCMLGWFDKALNRGKYASPSKYLLKSRSPLGKSR